ncbi:hypothetical protein ACIQ9R_13440 [Streptomyces sp. NPDC094447]|uniref:hypothetical protein n=1 Tax=Streptomyces sp. NPDC094447 TaxID=3366062 RepID=UPI0038190918
MHPEKAARPAEPEGCLTAAVRIPVRIVVLVLVVPLRLAWDALVLAGAFLRRAFRPLGRALGWCGAHVLTPLGRAVALTAEGLVTACRWLLRTLLLRPWILLWRHLVVPLAVHGVATPAAWLYRTLLAPLGRGLARATAWAYTRLLAPLGRGTGALLRALLVRPWAALWRYVAVPVAAGTYRWVLTPLGHGLALLARGAGKALVLLGRGLLLLARGVGWLLRTLLVTPAVLLYRVVLAPLGRILAVLGRELVDALAAAWRVAGHVSRAVGRVLRLLAGNLIGRPAAWFYRSVCTPVGHLVRDALWRPARKAAAEAGRAVSAALAAARATVTAARRDAWRALFGGPREPEPVPAIPGRARNLGGAASRQTVPGAAAESEISP